MYKGSLTETGKTTEELVRDLVRAVKAILNGNINSGGSVTLTQSATTTVINNRLIGSDSRIILCPTTSTAATGLDKVHYSYTAEYQITLTHDSTADTDRTYNYILLG